MKDEISPMFVGGCAKCEKPRTFRWRGEVTNYHGAIVLLFHCEACNHVVGVKMEERKQDMN